jgi:haloalkane dehalogenase
MVRSASVTTRLTTRPGWLDGTAYPFIDRFLDLPAGRLHYVDEGAGEPVLFVHGTPSWSFEWRHLIRALAPRWRCVAPDLLGFGLSARPRGFAYTPEAHAGVLADFVARLGLARFTLVVHDFGGPIGLPLCLDRPADVARLVLANTWMWSLDDDPGLARAGALLGGRLGRLAYRWANLSLRVLTPRAFGDRRRLTPAIHRHYLGPFPDRDGRERVLWTLARALLGAGAYYDRLWQRRDRLLGRPALLVWGLADPAFGPRHLARWQALLGSAAGVLALPGVGHWPHEEAPEPVARALAALLAGRADISAEDPCASSTPRSSPTPTAS